MIHFEYIRKHRNIKDFQAGAMEREAINFDAFSIFRVSASRRRVLHSNELSVVPTIGE